MCRISRALDGVRIARRHTLGDAGMSAEHRLSADTMQLGAGSGK